MVTALQILNFSGWGELKRSSRGLPVRSFHAVFARCRRPPAAKSLKLKKRLQTFFFYQHACKSCALLGFTSSSAHLRRARSAVQLPIILLPHIVLLNGNCIINLELQRLGGVEPLHQAWEARILPLYYSRVGKSIIAEKRRECKRAFG